MNSYQKQKARIAVLENQVRELHVELQIVCLQPESELAKDIVKTMQVWEGLHRIVDLLTATGETV
jgi:hypothetical protein